MKQNLLAGALSSLLLCASPLLGGCAGLGASDSTMPDAPANLEEVADAGVASHRVVDPHTGAIVSLEEVADVIADADVIFLGELHDSDSCHLLQIELTRILLERRGELAISMEMFERDNQGALDRYLAGVTDEETFREEARFWPNYDEHYRPAVELARDGGLPVLAANIPRPLAARVVREGLQPILAEEYAPRQAHAAAGEYRRRFLEVMGGMSEQMGWTRLENFFCAQCIKDDAMAESIADFLLPLSPPRPLVVHWCGAFHSDFGLGTVERLRQRMPGLDIVVLSPVKVESLDQELTEEERVQGRFLFVVKY
jgi:uncharacterized iron-regulated protein